MLNLIDKLDYFHLFNSRMSDVTVLSYYIVNVGMHLIPVTSWRHIHCWKPFIRAKSTHLFELNKPIYLS
jgi:hypothetical protein